MPKTPRVPTQKHLSDAKSKHLFEAIKSENDTFCAIVCASYVEHCLRALLRGRMVNGSTAKALLDPSKGAMGLIHVASQLAYSIGVISAGCMQRIQTIGLIRNLFAHSMDRLTFNDPEVVKLCNDLQMPSVCANDSRTLFTEVSRTLWCVLNLHAASAEHFKERVDDWPVIKRDQPSRGEQSAGDSEPKE